LRPFEPRLGVQDDSICDTRETSREYGREYGRMWARNGRVIAASVVRRGTVVSSKLPNHLQQCSAGLLGSDVSSRFYSSSRTVWKDDEDDKNRIIIPGQPEITTMGADDLTDEDIERILEEEERKLEDAEKAKFVENWKPGMRKRPLQMSYSLEEFEYELEPEKHTPRWNSLDKRCGALAIKVGMMPVFDDWGVRHPCTVLLLDKNIVLGHKTVERNGYTAVQVAAGERKRKNVGKCVLGQYKGKLFQEEDKNENPPYMVREFRVSDPKHLIPVNSSIHAMHFVPGQNVDVAGISKGKGFQGAMKRHNFGGMPASHGVSRSHRALGSTGQCQDPGRVFKGKKMAGHMGVERVTVQNKRLIKIDRGRNLLYVLGAVPGNRGEFVEVRDAVKKPLWNTDKVLHKSDRPPVPTFEFDANIDGSGQAGHEVFMPLPDRDPLLPDMDDEAA
jgi:large subunit ribosomal protein L3